MKKLLFSLSRSASFPSALSPYTPSKPVGGSGPQISIDKESHDYGTISQGANGTCEFTVTNTGDQPLIISQCQEPAAAPCPSARPSPSSPVPRAPSR